MRKTAIFFVSLMLLGVSARAETGLQVITKLFNRGVYFDQTRFPNAVLIDMINDIQFTIASIGMTNQAQSVYVLSTASRSYALPANFLIQKMAWLNPDPIGTGTKPVLLKYIPPEEMLAAYVSGVTDRPTSWTVWNDSLKLNAFSPTGDDTLTFSYFRTTVALADSSDTVDLDSKYIPAVVDILRQMCLERISGPAGQPEQKGFDLVAAVRAAVLEREPDVDTP